MTTTGNSPLLALRNSTPLLLEFSPDGRSLAQRYENLLINQIVPDPWARGLFRLVLREVANGETLGYSYLAGAGMNVEVESENTLCWNANSIDGLKTITRVQIHPTLPAWMWSVTLINTSAQPRDVDVLLAQDIGLNDASVVSNNEAYNSHYIDLNPIPDPELGWVLFARQNQNATGKVVPALAVACMDGARAYATDGRQFFGAAHRLTGIPAAFALPVLPSRRQQYECAMACLQSHVITLLPDTSQTIRFVLRFIPDHPAATGTADIGIIRSLADWHYAQSASSAPSLSTFSPSLFVDTPVLCGDVPLVEDWNHWFPGTPRNVESTPDGHLLSFFTGNDCHVVSRLKEADIWRPHGHILRSGRSLLPDPGHFGLTCYASGIFAAQAYLGNPSLKQFLSIVRDQMGALRASGQRIFIKSDGRWMQLGVPSAYAMTPNGARWIYRLGNDAVIEIRVRCSKLEPASILEIHVINGEPREFLITHRLNSSLTDRDDRNHIEFNSATGTIRILTTDTSEAFAICAVDTDGLADMGGDELVCRNAPSDSANYVVFRTHPVSRFAIMMTAKSDTSEAFGQKLADLKSRVNEVFKPDSSAQRHGLLLDCPQEQAAERINEILPWFNHDAWIHFSAPHGLEQSGGGAWGVRDVCQGSMEWLLSTGQHEVAREVLCEVFSQQYAQDGDWPQWFMLPPHQNIRQKDSHGDILFWPVRALCLYIERSNDFSILDESLPFTDAESFQQTGGKTSVLEHCNRVIERLRERMLSGTALVNYGNGDWDDTLQPANPSLRDHMVSAWTVGLACQTLEKFAEVFAHIGDARREYRLLNLLNQMKADFRTHLMTDGVVAGFLIRDGKKDTFLLHPRDKATGIHYRLIPMTRAILANLFTPAEAKAHLELIAKHLRFPDGVRLMDVPIPYRGGTQRFFKRAETAANIGREIGLMYVHAHLRYAEALAHVGDGEGLWHALQLVNPVGLTQILPQAEARQSNVFFSSSDADFGDRYEAARRWEELRDGKIPVRGGWRLYSSGPGLFINLVRTHLLGIRETFDDVVFDPVLPSSLDGLVAHTQLLGLEIELRFSMRGERHTASSLSVNGRRLENLAREGNPYRPGGLRIPSDMLKALLTGQNNTIEIEL